MPANALGTADIALEIFGGIVSDIAPTDVPQGSSPDCQDVAFQVGLVKTRPGLQNVFTAIGGNPTVNYLKTFSSQTLLNRMLALDSLGNFYQENPQGTLAAIATGIPAAYAESASQFNREYIAFGDGKSGQDIPRQFDGTYFDRVSQGGPGAVGVIGEDTPASVNIAAAPSGAVRSANIVTITLSSAMVVFPQENVTIAGVTDASFNGTFAVLTVSGGPSGSLNFTYAQIAANATSGSGTAVVTTQVAAGLHKVTVLFKTRQGYLTSPAPPVNYQATGGTTKRLSLTSIPTGPPNVIARVVAMTLAGQSSYFYTSSMVISDNTSTSLTVDVSDAILGASTNVDYLFKLIELGECSGVIDYASRLFWWGERNKINNLVNPGFDGGFGAAGSSQSQTSVGPLSPSVAANVAYGDTAWVNPNNVFAADGVSSGATINPNGVGYSYYLKATGYGFAIPSNATINGILVKALVKGSTSGDISDISVKIVKAGTITGTEHANGNILTNVLAYQNYGGSADLWGLTWTPADINNANFGVAYAAQNLNLSFTRTASVDYISITVYYTAPVAGGTVGPWGWTQGASYAGGASAITSSLPVYWGDAYSITGDGATATRGQITQSAYQDYLQVPIIARNTAYNVRARIAKNSALTQGTLHINLQSTSGAFTTPGLAVQANQATTAYKEFDAVLTTALVTPPSDLVLQVYADGTPTNNGSFLVDCIEVYPSLQPNNATLVRASRVEDPESYDGVNGMMIFGENDGTRITSGFKLRDKLYFVKERSLWVTQDDGVHEPSQWSASSVAPLGTPSNHGVGIGEDWVVIAGRSGLYFFNGGEPEKISQEIQRPNGSVIGWDSINWQYGHTLWCTVDTLNRRIMVGVPTGAATSPNVVFVMDYRGLDTGGQIQSDTSVHISPYSGKILQIANSRKWTRWNMAINSCALTERTDGTAHVFMGCGSGIILATDNFNRANQNPIAGSWTNVCNLGSGCTNQLLNNALYPSAVSGSQTSAVNFYSGISYPPDQYVQASVAQMKPDSGYLSLYLRDDGTGLNNYDMVIDSSGQGGSQHGGVGNVITFAIFKTVGGILTHLTTGGMFTPVTLQLNDVFRFQVIGNVLSAFQNGVLIVSITDNSFASGSPALGISPIATTALVTDIGWDNFSAGAVETAGGAGDRTGKIYDLLENQYSDDGVPINSYYDTYFFIRPDQEEMLQLGSHRKLYYYLTGFMEGSGTPIFTANPPGNFPGISIPQSGAAAPALQYSQASVAIASIARTLGVVTVTTSTAHGLTQNSNAIISGVADTSYNGIFGGLTILNATSFSYIQAGAGGSSSGGTVSVLTRDMEIPINILAERVKFRVQTNAVGSWFTLRNLTVSLKPDPFSPVRGTN